MCGVRAVEWSTALSWVGIAVMPYADCGSRRDRAWSYLCRARNADELGGLFHGWFLDPLKTPPVGERIPEQLNAPSWGPGARPARFHEARDLHAYG